MAVEIISNGSKWAGEEPDTLAQLLERLETCTLDPRFEAYGNFASEVTAEDILPGGRAELVGLWRLFGNFYDYSHVFTIYGPFEDLAHVVAAIHANQATERYAVAKREIQEHERAQAKRVKQENEQRRRARVAELQGLLTATMGA